MRRFRTLISAVVVGALVACGGGDDDSSSEDTPTASQAPSASEASSPIEALPDAPADAEAAALINPICELFSNDVEARLSSGLTVDFLDRSEIYRTAADGIRALGVTEESSPAAEALASRLEEAADAWDVFDDAFREAAAAMDLTDPAFMGTEVEIFFMPDGTFSSIISSGIDISLALAARDADVVMGEAAEALGVSGCTVPADLSE